MDSHMIRTAGSSLSLSALIVVLSACGTAVEVGNFEDGSGGAGGGSTGVGRGGDDTQVTSSSTEAGSTGTETGSTGSGTGSSGSQTGSTGTETGSSSTGGGVPCGGFAGDTCAETEFCDFEQAGCDFADGQGTCAPRPQACPFDVVIPVCACNGEVYQSECWANLAGVDVTGDDSCGSSGTQCGGKTGGTCEDDEFCDFAQDSCGFADESGVCRTRPTQCPDEADVPCACDGENYWSACEAARHGSDIWGGADFCPPPEFCGGLAGIQCAEDQFCDYPNDSFCGGDDSQGICRARPTECPEPQADEAVCGCDFGTYGSECEANLVGMDVIPGDALECGGA